MFKLLRRDRKGFTLIELIVVIAIIGILALIAVPRIGGFRDQADIKSAVATCRTIATAVASFQAQVGSNERPSVDELDEYLNNVNDLNGKYTINYVGTGDGATGEIANITLTTPVSGLSIWTPGSDTLVAPTP